MEFIHGIIQMINFVLFQDKDAKIFNTLIPHNKTYMLIIRTLL